MSTGSFKHIYETIYAAFQLLQVLSIFYSFSYKVERQVAPV